MLRMLENVFDTLYLPRRAAFRQRVRAVETVYSEHRRPDSKTLDPEYDQAKRHGCYDHFSASRRTNGARAVRVLL